MLRSNSNEIPVDLKSKFRLSTTLHFHGIILPIIIAVKTSIKNLKLIIATYYTVEAFLRTLALTS
jgi:hypothetical protein